MAMYVGSAVDHASWMTMLPGCLLAGIGLGLTNTPVTNTTTGAVPSARAGMASGIDMSARLITLAVNIALMGFILLEGIHGHLRGALSASLDARSCARWRRRSRPAASPRSTKVFRRCRRPTRRCGRACRTGARASGW
jgi:hypothetical protein